MRTFFMGSLDGLFLTLLLIVFLGLTCISSSQESVTIDEFRHLSTGVYYWQTGDLSFDNATPPLWKMAMTLPAHLMGAKPAYPSSQQAAYGGWEPWLAATDFMRNNSGSYTLYLQSARLVNVLAACATLLYLYRRARLKYGSVAIIGTAALAFSPTFLAHAHYATTDIIATLTIMVLLFQLIDMAKAPGWSRLAGISLLLATALLCKYSAIIMILPFIAVMAFASPKLAEPLFGRFAGLTLSAVQCAASFLAAILITISIMLVTINLQYGFRDGGARLSGMELQSSMVQTLASSPLGDLSLPLPTGFVTGFDRQKADSEQSEFPSFLMGSWSDKGFWYYYPVAFLIKETIPFVLMLMAVMAFTVWRRNHLDRREFLLLWYLPAALFLVLGFMNRLDVGVRYLLPAYPVFCYFFSGVYAGSRGGSVYHA